MGCRIGSLETLAFGNDVFSWLDVFSWQHWHSETMCFMADIIREVSSFKDTDNKRKHTQTFLLRTSFESCVLVDLSSWYKFKVGGSMMADVSDRDFFAYLFSFI